MAAAETELSAPSPGRTRKLDVKLFDALLAARGATSDTERAEVCGTDRTTIWRWRTKQIKQPNLDQAVRLTKILGVSIDQLFPEAD